MALTKEINVLIDEIQHVSGDQYSIPVKLSALNNGAEVFSRTITVDHKTNRTIAESFAQENVRLKFQTAIDEFKGVKAIAAQAVDIENSAADLLAELNV